MCAADFLGALVIFQRADEVLQSGAPLIEAVQSLLTQGIYTQPAVPLGGGRKRKRNRHCHQCFPRNGMGCFRTQKSRIQINADSGKINLRVLLRFF
jgi:hypothetical protein